VGSIQECGPPVKALHALGVALSRLALSPWTSSASPAHVHVVVVARIDTTVPNGDALPLRTVGVHR
jgi:hypothetical protein